MRTEASNQLDCCAFARQGRTWKSPCDNVKRYSTQTSVECQECGHAPGCHEGEVPA